MTRPAGAAEGRYSQLENERSPFLQRGRECSRLTIPSLLPEDGHSGTSALFTPYQGLGARGVNNLASKLVLALLPPNAPFFRLSIDDFALAELTEQPGMRAKVEEALASVERAVQNYIETGAIRVSAFEAIRLLVTTGNVLLYLPPEGGMRVYRLDRFVVKRDPMGHVLEILTKEAIAPDALPDSVRDAVKEKVKGSAEKVLNLYTWIRRDRKEWKVHQEIKGITVPESQGSYPLDRSPFIPLRWTKIDGEDYGRGHVEEYIGDLKSLEGLTQAIVEGAAAAAKVVFLVNPNGVTDQETLANAENCDVVEGTEQDVSTMKVDKASDFRVAYETMGQISERMSFAFLMNTAIQRQAERVTAEEIRYMAGELEDALGGVYSILSQEFQLPLVNRIMDQMARMGRLPELPKDTIKPTIVTGIEALGRGHDLTKLDLFMTGLANTIGPEAVARYVNVADYITRRGTALGIDMQGLVKTEQEIAQADQQAQLMALVQQLGPEALNQLGGLAQKGMDVGAKASSG